jgi:hypothetical protein
MSARAFVTTCLFAALVVFGAGSAQAQSGYRYWSFWQVENSEWRYSQIGPANITVADGDVHGWRFGISTQDGAVAPKPRTDPGQVFERICGTTSVSDGNVRVAVLIDPGQQDIAPFGEQVPAAQPACAVVPEGSTGATALSTVAELRIQDGFICGINGYPSSECAVSVDVPSMPESDGVDVLSVTTASASESVNAIDDPLTPTVSGNEPLPLIIGGAVILAGLATAWFVQRRRT